MDSNDKVFGILSYIGILWIVGLAAGKTPFAKFHANQGLVLFLAEIVIGIAGGILSFGFIGGIVSGLGSLASLVLMILGIVNVAQGEMKPLPVIGGITIIK